MPGTRTNRTKNRRGALTVEFAVTVGLAFFFFFAAFEFSRAYMISHTIEAAIYDGARAGIVPGATATDVENETRRVLGSIGVRTFSVDVRPRNIQIDTPEIEVRVEVPIDQNLFSPVNFFRGRSINRTFTMQREIPD